jgi:signal transduction histidine kinase
MDGAPPARPLPFATTMETLSRARAALSANPLIVDTAIAVFLAALSLLAYVGGARDVGPQSAVTVACCSSSLPLIVRRRFPLAVLAVITGATVVHVAILPRASRSRRAWASSSRSIPSVSLSSAGVPSLRPRWRAPFFRSSSSTGRGIVAVALSIVQTQLIFVVAWLLGDASRIRRLYADRLEERAQMLERQRDEETERAVREERERIARELHDVVTHHVSVMVIQAGGALRVIDRRPEEARTALEAISTAGRLALTDMRRMLGILGEQEASDPTPGLDRLDELLEQLRAAGLAVELVVEGERRPLDPGLEVSAYRIIQESLTNTLKHARGGRARVVVRYATDALEIAIEDERGPGTPGAVEPPHEGRGLIGMRERAAMLRGTLIAHPTATGFLVTAHLPIDGAASAA